MLPLKSPVGAGATAAVAVDAMAKAVVAISASVSARRSKGFMFFLPGQFRACGLGFASRRGIAGLLFNVTR